MKNEWKLNVRIEVMPDFVQKIISLFPLTQGIQLMKAAFLGLPVPNPGLPIAVMGIVTVACTATVMGFFKWE